MSLPSKLLYGNKVNASYARNYTSNVQCQNSSAFGLGSTAVINIPCSRNTVLSGADSLLNIRLKFRNTEAAAQVSAVFCRGGIAGCIQRLRIFANGTLINDLDNYGNLINFLTPYQMSSDNCLGKNKVLQGTTVVPGVGMAAQPFIGALAANTDSPSFNFTFPLLSIMSLTDQYVPLYALQNLRLEIQFVSELKFFINCDKVLGAPGTENVFNDVKLVANFIELSDRAMEVIEKSLDGKAVQWSCTSYSNFVSSNALGIAASSMSIPIPCKVNSLQSIYITMRTQDAGGASLFADDMPNFLLSQYQFRIGSKVLPSDVFTTVPQFLAELERAMGCVSNKTQSSYNAAMITGTAASGASKVVSSAFGVGLETQSYANVAMGSLYTGMNTTNDDIYYLPQFAALDPRNIVIRFDIYCYYDSLIVIDGGNVSLVY